MDTDNTPLQQQPDATPPMEQTRSSIPTEIQQETEPGKKKVSPFVIIIIGIILIGIIGVIAYVLLTKPEEEITGETDAEEEIVIGLSLATQRTERWQRDREFIIEEAAKYNAIVNVTNANDDTALQLSQVENLILQGVDVLIIVPIDGDQAAEMVDIANQHDVPVIAYDRMINSAGLDYYVSFDSVKVGEYQAQGVLDVVDTGTFLYVGGSENDNNAHLLKEGSWNILQPYLDTGDIEFALETFTPDWRQEDAYQDVKTYLEDGGEVDAVVAANDGTAFGTIQALEEFDLAGIVPVSGQDAELTACQRIVEGTQTVTVYKPLETLAAKAVEIAVRVARGESASTNTTVSNEKADIPSYLIDPTKVTKDNMIETIVKSGFHSFEDVYKNIPEDQRPEYTT